MDHKAFYKQETLLLTPLCLNISKFGTTFPLGVNPFFSGGGNTGDVMGNILSLDLYQRLFDGSFVRGVTQVLEGQ